MFLNQLAEDQHQAEIAAGIAAEIAEVVLKLIVVRIPAEIAAEIASARRSAAKSLSAAAASCGEPGRQWRRQGTNTIGCVVAFMITELGAKLAFAS